MPRAEIGVSALSFEPESTRDAILRTAGEVFLTHGYEQSSMEQIALQSGVARRTLYNHFSSKKALFDATISRMWERMPLTPIVDATSGTQSPEEVLQTIGLTIASFWTPPEAVAFVRLVIWESPRFPEIGTSFLDGGTEPARAAVKKYVRRLSRQSDFRIPDPDLAATQFIDVILGEVVLGRLATSRVSSPDEQRRRYVVREAVALFMARYHVPQA
jgi:AcrR family transcriptional regulator